MLIFDRLLFYVRRKKQFLIFVFLLILLLLVIFFAIPIPIIRAIKLIRVSWILVLASIRLAVLSLMISTGHNKLPHN
ncbi:MAG: hypothetical protein COA42_13680 [Alteromonadaceae bacterium]|nr:MAG: hypothetical protein COA42_13680 [Alteromonadaceae bacterium]